MFDWLKIKSTLEEARNECKKIRAKIASNKLRMEELKHLPPPRAELAELVIKFIDEVSDFYPQKLAASLQHFIQNPLDRVSSGAFDDEGSERVMRVLTATEASTVRATPKTIETALFYLLGDQLKAGVRKVVQEMEYPAIVGPAMPARLAEIKRLTQENTELEAKMKALESDLAQTVA